ncbi:hypothetical protein Tco_0771841 [Tanacetum coccineum]|uniref:Uncharacterized protein n=1 Tax=Tanacetum coccineum TaxID=301880 RepID=A0ABQ4ZGI6_9ASTR
MENELSAHQRTISTISFQKQEHEKFFKTHEDKEIEKVISLEKQVKVLNDIAYKTGQLVQTMNMLIRNYKTSFVKPQYLKKVQSVNPSLYNIGCYNDNLALILAPETDETIRLAQESRSKLNMSCNYLEALEKYLELTLQHEKENNVCENSWVKQSLILGDTEKALKDKTVSLIVELNCKTVESHDLRA